MPTDYDLRITPEDSPVPPEPPAPSPRGAGLWIVLALLAAAGAAAGYFGFVWREKPVEPVLITVPSSTAKAASPPLGGRGEAVALPPLDASDALVRNLVRMLSQSPATSAWLATNGLIRNFAVVVGNIADGATPAKQLTKLRPSSPFQAIDQRGTMSVDPRSYDRYAAIADAVESIDAAGAANLYATLKPRIEEAHRDLGSPDPSFDHTLERAIVALLNTPVPDGQLPLKPKGIGYAYADDRLEALTGAQKQLLRMGPRNARIIKTKLRDIALALGIPASHLPTS